MTIISGVAPDRCKAQCVSPEAREGVANSPLNRTPPHPLTPLTRPRGSSVAASLLRPFAIRTFVHSPIR